MQEVTEKMNIEHQQSDKKRSICTSILKWTFIVLNVLALLFNTLVMYVDLKILYNESGWVARIISVRIFSSLLNVGLSIVAIVAAFKENTGWLKKINRFVSGICAIGVLFITLGYIAIYRVYYKKNCLRKYPEFCEHLVSHLDDMVVIVLMLFLFSNIIYLLIIWKLTTNLLDEKSTKRSNEMVPSEAAFTSWRASLKGSDLFSQSYIELIETRT